MLAEGNPGQLASFATSADGAAAMATAQEALEASRSRVASQARLLSSSIRGIDCLAMRAGGDKTNSCIQNLCLADAVCNDRPSL